MFNINSADQLIAFINSAPKINLCLTKNAKIAL